MNGYITSIGIVPNTIAANEIDSLVTVLDVPSNESDEPSALLIIFCRTY